MGIAVGIAGRLGQPMGIAVGIAGNWEAGATHGKWDLVGPGTWDLVGPGIWDQEAGTWEAGAAPWE